MPKTGARTWQEEGRCPEAAAMSHAPGPRPWRHPRPVGEHVGFRDGVGARPPFFRVHGRGMRGPSLSPCAARASPPCAEVDMTLVRVHFAPEVPWRERLRPRTFLATMSCRAAG